MRAKVRCSSADTSPKFINLRSILGHARSMADGWPWPYPDGKPCHEFVCCGCHAGTRMLSYDRTHMPSAVGWLRCLVRSFEPCILTVAESSGERWRWKKRDRKVARAASHCMVSTTGMIRVAQMVNMRADSSRRGRTITSVAAFDGEKWSV